MKMRQFLGILIVLAAAEPAHSGVIDTTSGLVYHLDAGLGVATSGGLVTQWDDQSGNTNHFLGTGAATEPTWVSSVAGFNNLPAVHFDGSGLHPLKLDKTTTPRTVFIVNRTDEPVPNGAGIWGKASGDHGLRRRFPASTGWYNGNPNDFAYQGALYVNGAAGGGQSYATPGIVEAYSADAGPTWTATSLGGYYAGRAWAGDIAEVAVFDRVLTEAEATIIVNHLGAKYGIDRAGRQAYFGDSPANGNYDFDVVGIGRSADGGAVITSADSKGLTLSELSGLDAGDYLLAGQKLDTNAWTTDGASAVIAERWERVWYLEKTNSLSANLTFDFSDAGLTYDAGRTYLLLYSSTNGFDFQVLPLTGSPLGDAVTFAVDNANLDTGYYTLGALVVPEPPALTLLATALGGLLGFAWWKRK